MTAYSAYITEIPIMPIHSQRNIFLHRSINARFFFSVYSITSIYVGESAKQETTADPAFPDTKNEKTQQGNGRCSNK